MCFGLPAPVARSAVAKGNKTHMLTFFMWLRRGPQRRLCAVRRKAEGGFLSRRKSSFPSEETDRHTDGRMDREGGGSLNVILTRSFCPTLLLLLVVPLLFFVLPPPGGSYQQNQDRPECVSRAVGRNGGRGGRSEEGTGFWFGGR